MKKSELIRWLNDFDSATLEFGIDPDLCCLVAFIEGQRIAEFDMEEVCDLEEEEEDDDDQPRQEANA